MVGGRPDMKQRQSFRDEWLSKLRGDPSVDPWKIHQYEVLANIVAQRLNATTSIIDLGCGEVLFTKQLRDRVRGVESVIGMDLEPSPLWSADNVVTFQVGDAADPPFAPGSADVVIAKDLLHHMPDPAEGVRAIVRTARIPPVLV